ncbi:hypothetical protein B0H14DRAFT_3150667 [Mycena olivaceomarginata]|nr:hypothetical protein B0H14DRAFT_3150667 [Mycena olivaceomarginata]
MSMRGCNMECYTAGPPTFGMFPQLFFPQDFLVVEPSPRPAKMDAQYYDARSRYHDHHKSHVEGQWTPPCTDYNFSYQPQAMLTAMPPSAFHQSSSLSDTGEYLRQQLNLTGVIPDLWCLPEPAGGLAGSPKKRLTLQEVYQELATRFQWFRENQHDEAWKPVLEKPERGRVVRQRGVDSGLWGCGSGANSVDGRANSG